MAKLSFIRCAMACAVAASSTGCGDGTLAPPGDGRAAVIVTVGDTWARLDPETGRLIWTANAGMRIEQGVLSPDGRVILAGYGDELSRRFLAAIDAATGRELWRMPLSTAWVPEIGDGIGLLAASELAIRPDGAVLWIWHATLDGTVGVATLDLQTRRPLAFSGPWNVAAAGLVPVLTPAPGFPDGFLAVLASQDNGGPTNGEAIHLLHPVSLQPMDSITLAEVPAAGGDIWQVVPSRDGRTLYIAGDSRLLRFDLETRRITAQTPRLATGSLRLTPDGRTLIQTDGGWWPDTPGSGIIRLYDEQLVLVGTIDASTPVGGMPDSPTASVMGPAHPSADGTTIYVRTGTAAIGPLYPKQRSRLLVIDLPTRSVRRVIELDGYGRGLVLVAQ